MFLIIYRINKIRVCSNLAYRRSTAQKRPNTRTFLYVLGGIEVCHTV